MPSHSTQCRCYRCCPLLPTASAISKQCRSIALSAVLFFAVATLRHTNPGQAKPLLFSALPRAEVPLQALAVRSCLCLRYAMLSTLIRCSARLFHCISKHGQPVPWLFCALPAQSLALCCHRQAFPLRFYLSVTMPKPHVPMPLQCTAVPCYSTAAISYASFCLSMPLLGSPSNAYAYHRASTPIPRAAFVFSAKASQPNADA